MGSLLMNRMGAIAACFIGVFEVLLAVITIICSFSLWASFCNHGVMNCSEGVEDNIGMWLGFPLLVPGILGLFVLATRKKSVGLIYTVANLALLALAIAHIVLTIQSNSDYWGDLLDAYDNNRCSQSLENSLLYCDCMINGKNTRLETSCEMISFGSSANWLLIVISVIIAVTTLVASLIGLIGSCFASVKE